MKIIKLQISNWKSFSYAVDPEPIVFNENLNIFIGPNSSGKTNLANAIRMACGYGPDYGGDQKLRANKEIQITDFNQTENDESIEIAIQTTDASTPNTLTIQQDQVPYAFKNHQQKSFFATGAKKDLFRLTTVQSNRNILQKKWDELRNEMFMYFEFELQENPPISEDHLLSDLFDQNGQRLYEAGSGIASLLYYLIELKIHIENGVRCFLFEEPEVHMHPSLLRQWTKYLIDQNLQFFITTHSSLFIDETLRAGGYIFQFHKEKGFTKVLNITSHISKHRDVVYKQLGNIPNDILLANAVIWVEGPSDVIYLRHWLNGKAPNLVEYRDYAFMFYGGSLIHHISFENIDVEKLIELCSISPNSIIVIDSDRSKMDDELKPNADKVQKNFNSTQKFAWITGGREIENYVHPEILKDAVRNTHPESAKFKIGSKQYDKMVQFAPNPHAFLANAVAMWFYYLRFLFQANQLVRQGKIQQ